MLLLFTVFSASIDAFAIGVALSLGNKIGISHIFCVLICTFFMSFLALLLASYFQNKLTYFSVFGCVLLLFIGVKNIVESLTDRKVKSLSPCLVGISVGIDAMVASFTFAVPLLFAFMVATIMSVFHGVFFILGKYSSNLIKNDKNFTFVSGVFLILLGIYRLF